MTNWGNARKFMRRGMRWEAPSMTTAAYDPGRLREQETPLVIRPVVVMYCFSNSTGVPVPRVLRG